MTKPSWLLFLFLLSGLAACHKVSPKKPQQVKLDTELAQTSPRPCPGTAQKVRDNCGCNPIDNSLITVVETLQINQSIKARVQSCAQGKFGVDVTSAVIAKSEFQSCVSKDVNITPEVQAQLLAAVDEATKDSARHQQELSSWLVCYDLQTGVAAEKRRPDSSANNKFSVGGEADKKPTSGPAQTTDTTEIKDCDPSDFEACQKACEAEKAKSCASFAAMLRKPGPSQDAAKAIGAYQKACDKGEPPACNSLGFMYSTAEGTPKDDKKAFSLFVKACDASLAVGCFNVGLNSYFARGAPKDDKKAAVSYQKACDDKYPAACTSLGDMYKNGEGVTADEANALKLYAAGCDLKNMAGCDKLGNLYLAQNEYLRAITVYQKSCDSGTMTSCTHLGDMYVNGKGVKTDTTKGLSLYQKACDSNELQSCVNIGRMYAFGVGVTADPAKAKSLDQKACNGSNYAGCADLGRLYFDNNGSPRDGAAALNPLVKACDNKIGQGCFDLAALYSNGAGVSKDLLKASTLLLDSCDMSYYRACVLLGNWYERGQNGLSQDAPAAIKLYQKGIDGKEPSAFLALGYLYLDPGSAGKDVPKGLAILQRDCDESGLVGSEACINLGFMYLSGSSKLGITQDVPKATGLFQKGCDYNNSYSCATLGGVYLLGERVPKDPKKAASLYQKACDNKDARSCQALGLLYKNGTDLPKDLTRAAALFAKACELGNKESCAPEIGGM